MVRYLRAFFSECFFCDFFGDVWVFIFEYFRFFFDFFFVFEDGVPCECYEYVDSVCDG